VARAKQSADRLDAGTYARLAEKSRRNPVVYYSAIEPRLFDSIITKYNHEHARVRR